eukprot:COSAG06_NODE_14037_length_1195_cov_1.403285_2_plen_107_part_00
MTEPYAGVWLGFANMLSVTTPTAASSAGTTEVELAYSTDLLHWQYVSPGTPFIPRGAPGSFDCCEIFGAKQQPVRERNPSFLLNGFLLNFLTSVPSLSWQIAAFHI